MNAEELLNKLSINNFEVKLEGESLKVMSGKHLPPNLLAEIKMLKPKIILFLSPKCIVCGIELKRNTLDCPLGCSQQSEPQEDWNREFENLFKRHDKDEIEQIFSEFNERVAIIMEDKTATYEEAVKTAKIDCVSRWKNPLFRL